MNHSTPTSTPSGETPPASDRIEPRTDAGSNTEAEHIQLSPLLVTLGISALVLGIVMGLVMSQATLLR